MMKIKEIHIVFENFEMLKIPYQYVGQMRLDYITDSIIKVNNLSKEDNVTEYKFANSAFICIDSKFNRFCKKSPPLYRWEMNCGNILTN